jgi:hypothetical protein
MLGDGAGAFGALEAGSINRSLPSMKIIFVDFDAYRWNALVSVRANVKSTEELPSSISS